MLITKPDVVLMVFTRACRSFPCMLFLVVVIMTQNKGVHLSETCTSCFHLAHGSSRLNLYASMSKVLRFLKGEPFQKKKE